jgi:hypothetical protein
VTPVLSVLSRSRLLTANLLLRFIVELAALAGLAFWGWTAGHSTTGQWVLAVATPTVAAWVWGMYAAPASSHRLAGPARLTVEWLVLGGAAVATAVAGLPGAALAFVLVAAGNALVLSRMAPKQHSAGGCQCCSAGGTTEVVSAATSADRAASRASSTAPTAQGSPVSPTPSTAQSSPTAQSSRSARPTVAPPAAP